MLVAKKIVERLTYVISGANRHLNVVQQRHKFYLDKHMREASYHVDQQLLVSTSNSKLKVSGVGKSLSSPYQDGLVGLKRGGVVRYRMQLHKHV